MNITSERNDKTLKMEWGFSPPVAKPFAFGARAIFRRGRDVELDFVWDRQSIVGGTMEERKEFSNWLNTIGIPRIRKMVVESGLSPSDADQEFHTMNGFEIVFSPKKSYGYMYIGVWPAEDTIRTEEVLAAST